MKIVTLVENTSISPEYGSKHGLCFYIETQKHKILFDLGEDCLFLENAKKLDIDIAEIDTVIISHGHSDHGGALALFLQHNQTAKVYINENAFADYRAKVLGISIKVGLDCAIMNHPAIVLTKESLVIDDELFLFSGITERECYASSNDVLFVKTDTGMQRDDFSHEQNLMICERENHVLFAGCAHNGIINIQSKAESLIHGEVDFIISGFHLFNPTNKKGEKEELIQEIAYKLQTHNTKYFTCHCTGERAFRILQSIMGEQIDYLSAGRRIEL